MTDLLPLTQLKPEAEAVAGRRIALLYRDIYTMAVDGRIDVEWHDGRWRWRREKLPALAEELISHERSSRAARSKAA